MAADDPHWPALPLAAWEPTRATLHMRTQIVGKIRLALCPYVNHCWQVPLYVSDRGLTTAPMPYDGGNLEIRFDFIAHELVIEKSDGATRRMPLALRSVADFYGELMATLRSMDVAVKIWTMPVEITDPIRFDKDHTHASYDRHDVERFWRALVSVDAVLKEFRGRFIGKCSPVHFFWGSFDLAVTRFSGRRAPDNPAAAILVVVSVVVVVAAVVVQPVVERYMTWKLDRRLAFGRLEVTCGNPLAVEIRELRLANAPWGSGPEMVRIDSVSARLDVAL